MKNSGARASTRIFLRLSCRVILLTLLIAVWPVQQSAATEDHSVISSAAEIDYPPFSIVDDSGRATGFSVELLRATLKEMGREVTFRTGVWSDVKSWLEQGEVAALPLVGRTPERENIFDFTFPYMTLHGAIVVRNDTTGIENLDELQGKVVAVMKGDNAEEFLERENREITIVSTPTFEIALHELSEGAVDAVVMQRLVALRLIRKTGLANLKIIDSPVTGFEQDFCFAVAEGDKDTLELLNEGLALVIADGTFRHLHAKWFATLELPNNRRVIVGGDHNFAPYEFLDEQGLPAGFNVDLVRAIAREIGLSIEIRLRPWETIVRQLKQEKIDIIQGMFYSPERDHYLDFSPPYIVSHYISVVRKGEMVPPESIEALTGKSIVVQSGDIAHEFAVEHGLTNRIAIVDSQEDALRQLVEGKHDVALVARVSTLYWIEKNGWTDLELGKQPFISPEYGFAASPGQKALLAQFSEGLHLVEESGEYRRIRDKWLGGYEDYPADPAVIFRYAAYVAIPLLVLLMMIAAWVWALKRQVGRRTVELQHSEERQRSYLENSPYGIFIANERGEYVEVNPAACRITGYDKQELLSMSIPDLLPPESIDEGRRHFQRVVEERQSYGESIFLTKSGEKRWWSIFAVKLSDTRYLGFTDDITERKRAEDDLKESEQRFRHIFSNVAVGVTRVSLDLKIESVNRAYCRMLGYEESELIGKDLKEFTHPESLEENISKQTQLAGGEIDHYRMEKQFIHKSGKTIHGILDANLIRDAQGRPQYFLGSVLDISERKKAEDDLLESKQILQNIAENMFDLVSLTDLTGSFVYVSPSHKMLGYAPAELLGSQVFDFIHPEEAEYIMTTFADSLDTLDSKKVEYRYLRKDGTYCWLESMGKFLLDYENKPSAIIFSSRDISRHKQLETELRKSKEILDDTGKMGKIGGWEHNLATGKAVWTRTLYDIVEFPDDRDPPGVEEHLSYYPEPDREILTKAYEESIAHGTPFDLELQVNTEGKKSIWCRVQGEPVFENGECVAMHGTFQDITDRKKLEQQLLQAQKLESVGRLAGGVAHDFNNMLGAILGYTEIALSQLPDDHPVREDLEQVSEAAKRSANLTRQLLAFARKQTIRPKLLNLNETIPSMLNMLRRIIGEDVDLSWSPGHSLWNVKIDPTQIDQLLANLAANARDAIAGVGKLSIETKNEEIDEEFCAEHADASPGQYVLISVNDNGVGMSKEVIEHIFEPFYTTKGIGEGTGIGLATVYGIVKQNNGFIFIDSEPGHGSTFHIYLPRDTADLDEVQTEEQTSQLPQGSETVLIVEDEISILKLGQRILEKAGYRVLTANSPTEALELVERQTDQIKLLITDVVMPEMNGLELAKKIAARNSGMKCLFMSGYTADVIADRGILDEEVEFIQKPFSQQVLTKKVREVLDK